jgi:hypothetical protein
VPTKSTIDHRLVKYAQKLGRHRTRKSAVEAALKYYIRHRKQAAATQLFGKIDYEAAYDYKRERTKKRMKCRRVSLPIIRSRRPGTLHLDNDAIARLVTFP